MLLCCICILESRRIGIFAERSIVSESDDTDPPLAKAAFLSNRFDTPESSVDDITYEIGSSSPYANNGVPCKLYFVYFYQYLIFIIH